VSISDTPEVFNSLIAEGERLIEQSNSTEVDFFAKFGEREAENARLSNAYLLKGLGYKGLGNKEIARKNLQQAVDLSAGNLYANVELEVQLSEIPAVHLSQTEMQQVFLNVINNALDAMEKEGGVLKISSRKEGDFIVVELADNGPGIPAANLQRIFDPFFTTKPVGKGTGLGLSICYGIIKNLGGEIVVKSTVGVGTTFYIKIPLKDNKS